MDNTTFLGMGAILSPILVIVAGGFVARLAKKQEYDREDDKARLLKEEQDRAAKASADLLAVQKQTVEAVTKQAEVTTQIHGLTNSLFTQSRLDLLTQTRRTLILLKAEAHRQEEEAHRKSTKSHTEAVKDVNGVVAREAAAEIVKCEEDIARLEKEIAERQEAAATAEKVLAAKKGPDIEPPLPGTVTGIILTPPDGGISPVSPAPKDAP